MIQGGCAGFINQVAEFFLDLLVKFVGLFEPARKVVHGIEPEGKDAVNVWIHSQCSEREGV